MNLDRKLGGFAPNNSKAEDYVQEEYYCELCGRVSKEETELDQKTNKFHERQFDFCLYFRKHPNKNELFFKKFIDDFEVNFPSRKLIIFGDDPKVRESDNIKFLGTVDNKIILDYFLE